MARRCLAGLLILLGGSACKGGGRASEAPAAVPSFACKRSAFGDIGATEYDCPDEASAQLCSTQSVVRCRPTNRTRGTVTPGAACRRGTWNPEVKGVFELGDDCAPLPRFASEDTPKGSVCVKVSSEGAYCSHNCETAEDCADVRHAGFTPDCRGGGCFLIPK